MFYFFVGILLSACQGEPWELARNRAALAKSNDELASCKTYSQSEKFSADQILCGDFDSKNKECATFPETKPGCTEFLNTPSYAEVRYSCLGIATLANKCTQAVYERLWYKKAFDFKDNLLIKNLLHLIGIDLDEKWNDAILSFNPTIKIAAVAPGDTNKGFHRGVELAIEQINNSGGVLGRLIELVKYDQHAKIDESKDIAYKIINDESIVAVVGGQTSALTKPVTKIYERGGVLNFISFATNMDIINSDMKYTFRMIPDNTIIAAKTVEFCKKRNYKKMLIIAERNAYAEELGNAFYNSASDMGIKISYFKTFFSTKSDFIDIISEIGERKVDAIFFSGRARSASKFTIQLRGMNINTPIIGTDSMDDDNFIGLVGAAGEGIVVPSTYNEKSIRLPHLSFLEAYKKKYGVNPDTRGVQGYDAVKLLTDIMADIGSTIPEEIASITKLGDDWEGAAGKLVSDKKGGIKKEIFFRQLHLGEYQKIDE